MKKREYGDYIQDILDSINDIGKFTEGMDFDKFKKDKEDMRVPYKLPCGWRRVKLGEASGKGGHHRKS